MNTEYPYKTFGFSKAERLSSSQEIDSLFRNHESFFSYPFKCIYRATPSSRPLLQVLISVGKKYHKRAIRRNTVRRRGKEAFRLNKQIFYNLYTVTPSTRKYHIQAIFIYIGKEEENFSTIEDGIKKALHTLAATVSADNNFSPSAVD